MASGDSETACAYVFDANAWETAQETSNQLTESELDDGQWYCPHPAANDTDYCLFHLPPEQTDTDRVTAAFLERLEEPGRRPKQFIGARFDTLELEHAILESSDNYPIDLRHAQFDGEVDWQYAIVRQPLALDGAIFRGPARFDEVTFGADAFFSGARFASNEKAYFLEADFTKAAIFYDVSFPGDTSFFTATFNGRVDFIQSRFNQVNFREVQFAARARFKEATFGHAEFYATSFEGGADFRRAQFPESAGFRYATFGGPVRFREPATSAEICQIDLRDSVVPTGTLAQASAGTVLYNLRGASIGDLKPEERERQEWFEYLHLLNTTFDGFDFAAFHDQLATSEWRLHDTHEAAGQEWDAVTHGQRENTYLKAKNGANDIGDAKAAAEFFRKEMLFRRYGYVTQFREGDSLREKATVAWQWTANALLDVTSGYGERPSRVILFSTVVILAFAGLFALVWPVEPYGGLQGYLLVSLESFVTLVLGGGATVEDPQVRLLAEAEGFIGAFLIALFVFTLTRSIHR